MDQENSQPTPSTEEGVAKTVMNIGSVKVTCKTASGSAYVKKVTHPPTTIPNEYCGVPDNSAPNVVLMETKGESNFPPILTYPVVSGGTTTIKTINNTKMLFLQPSGGKVAAYCFLWNDQPPAGIQPGWVQPLSEPLATVPFSNVCPASANNTGYNWLNWFNDVGPSRTTYKSQTFYLNATNFNNQGTVTSAKFKPNILYGISFAELLETHKGDEKSNDNLIRLVRAVAARRKDDFEVVERGPKGYPTEYTFQVIEIDSPQAVLSPLPGSSMYAFSKMIADTPSDVLSISSRSATRPARDGSFVVHQPVNPVYEWTTTGDGAANIAPVITRSGPIISIMRTRVGNTFYYMPLYSESTIAATGDTPLAYSGDAPWNNLDWAITLFDGLTIPPTTGTSLSSVPYITIKSFCGQELQTQFFSSMRPFSRLLPPPDRDAMELATTIFHGRPDDLPAAANDLATIAATALKFMPTAVNWLKDLFGNKQQQTKAMDTANNFVRPQPKRPRHQASNGNIPPPQQNVARQLQQVQRQLAALTLAQNQQQQTATLPTYNTTPQLAPTPSKKRQSRSRTTKRTANSK